MNTDEKLLHVHISLLQNVQISQVAIGQATISSKSVLSTVRWGALSNYAGTISVHPEQTTSHEDTVHEVESNLAFGYPL